MDPGGHGALRRRHPVAGLGPQLSGRERRRCTRVSEQRLPVLGSLGRRSASEDLRRIHRERYVPTAERVVRDARRTELEPVLRRLAVLRGRAWLRTTWDRGREDAVLPERDPGRVLYPGHYLLEDIFLFCKVGSVSSEFQKVVCILRVWAMWIGQS